MFTVRKVNLGIVAICIGLMLSAWLYFQLFLGLEPCPLCMVQRGFVIGVGLMAALAWAHNPGVVGQRIYAVLGFLFAAGGAGVAARHSWLQYLPEPLKPDCGLTFDYMFDVFPFKDALILLFQGDGNCAKVDWIFLGLTIPACTLIAFVGLMLLNAWQVFRRDLPWR
jgi:protein dithiol:quinone oxidoreductase